MEPGFMMLVLEVLDQSLRKGVELQAGLSVLQLPGHFNAELKSLLSPGGQSFSNCCKNLIETKIQYRSKT